MSMVTILVVLLLAAAPLPFLPLLRSTAGGAPFARLRLVVAGLWAAWIAGAALLGAVSPALLYTAAAAAGIAMMFCFWRGRAAYGVSSGLPPGSLALAESLRAIVDRDYYLRTAARYGPVFKMSQFHRPTICVVGLERGHRLFREHRDAFGPVSQPFNRAVAGGFLRYMDTDTHGVYARLFGKALALPALVPTVRDVNAACERIVGTMAAACGAAPSGDVSPRAYCEQFSHDAFVRVLFGLNPDTPACAEFNAAYQGLRAYNIGARVDRKTAKSLEDLRALLHRHAATLEAHPATSPACTLTELQRLDTALPDRVCLDNLLFILKISSANVASLMLWLLKMLGEHPQWMSRIAAAGHSAGEPAQLAVIDSVVKETLRLAQSEYLYRRLLRDVEFEGMRLREGWLTRLCVRESHISGDAFANPRDFDPSRFLGKQSAVREYAPFGYGAHGCNGIAMNDVICRAFLRTLSCGFDWTITRDGPLERGFRHWSHWQPSSALRVRIAPRSVPVA